MTPVAKTVLSDGQIQQSFTPPVQSQMQDSLWQEVQRAKAMMEETWPPASIVQIARNTEQERDVKRASSSFPGSVPLLDLIT